MTCQNTHKLKLENYVIKKYLDKIFEINRETRTKKDNYYKLPYVGDMSKHTQTKIRELCKFYCKE